MRVEEEMKAFQCSFSNVGTDELEGLVGEGSSLGHEVQSGDVEGASSLLGRFDGFGHVRVS